jgi:methylated-DNA-[protein]-cysteine S-methyltransferase
MNAKDLKRLAGSADAERRSRAAAAILPEGALREHLVDVAVATMDSPIGELLVAVTPRGLACVAFDGEDREVLLERLARDLSPRILDVAAPTDAVRGELDEYFRHERTHFEVKVDRRLIGPFAWEVLRATRRVPFGHTATYGEVAARIGKPQAARAVGGALGSNPIPIVIPCHRVIGAGGKLTGYAGGLARKELLLELEGVLPPRIPGTAPRSVRDTR